MLDDVVVAAFVLDKVVAAAVVLVQLLMWLLHHSSTGSLTLGLFSMRSPLQSYCNTACALGSCSMMWSPSQSCNEVVDAEVVFDDVVIVAVLT